MDSFADRREKAEIGSDPFPQGPEARISAFAADPDQNRGMNGAVRQHRHDIA